MSPEGPPRLPSTDASEPSTAATEALENLVTAESLSASAVHLKPSVAAHLAIVNALRGSLDAARAWLSETHARLASAQDLAHVTGLVAFGRALVEVREGRHDEMVRTLDENWAKLERRPRFDDFDMLAVMRDHRLDRLARLTQGIAIIGLGLADVACGNGAPPTEPLHINSPAPPPATDGTASAVVPTPLTTASEAPLHTINAPPDATQSPPTINAPPSHGPTPPASASASPTPTARLPGTMNAPKPPTYVNSPEK